LTHFTVDSNAHGGILIAPTNVSAWTFILDSSFMRGSGLLLSADGYVDATGQVTVRGSHFRYGDEAIEGISLSQMVVQASTFDSVVGATFGPPVMAFNQVADVQITSDTIRGGFGSVIEVQNIPTLALTNGLIRGRQKGNPSTVEAGLGFGASGAVTVSGMRIDSSSIGAVRADGFQSGPIVIDSNSFTDLDTIAVQLSTGATVTRNYFARNRVAIDIALDGGAASGIHQNNFAGNTAAGLQNRSASTVVADSNYWNDPSGPSCLSGCPGVGDTISGPVTVNQFWTSPLQLPPGTPTLAPRFRTSVLPRQQVKREGRP
jgi:hypothetical protein